jgi:hypothetical protein
MLLARNAKNRWPWTVDLDYSMALDYRRPGHRQTSHLAKPAATKPDLELPSGFLVRLG